MATLIFGSQLTIEQRLEQATSKIMSHTSGKYDALPGLLMYGDCDVVNDKITACTDGKNEKYGREFCAKLSDPELRFLRMHEVMHKMRRDLHVWSHIHKLDAELANQACDYANNGALIDLDAGEGFIKMPECGLYDPKFKGMDAGKIFNILRQNKQQQQQQQQQQGGKQSSDKQGSSPSNNGKPLPTGASGNSPQSLDTHDWEAAGKLTEEERNERGAEIDEAIRQGNMLAGRGNGAGKRLVADMLQAKVRWEDALRDFLQELVKGNEFSTWRRFHRRGIANDMYLPSGTTEHVGEVLIAIDTSGSIGDTFVTQFLSEVTAICSALQPDGIRLLYWGSSVVGDEYYPNDKLDDLIRTTKPKDGGGTDSRCVVKYMESKSIKPQCVVVLTDGYVDHEWGGQWGAPLLWCIADNKHANPTNGKVVHIDI